MNRKCPRIVSRLFNIGQKYIARCATTQTGEDSGGGGSCKASKDIYHGMLSPLPGPLRFNINQGSPHT
jgi:hypothetical protein